MDYFRLGTFDEKSWHGKEQRLTHNDIWQAMQETGMADITFEKLQSYANHNNHWLPIEGKYQLVMLGAPWAADVAVPLGRQVSGYEPLQHKEMADLLQPLIDASNGGVKLKGVALVGSSAEVSFVQLDLGDFWVANDPDEQHNSLLLLSDNRLKSAVHWLHTAVRVVCSNTYSMAIQNIPPIPHATTTPMFLNFHAAVLEGAIKAKQSEQVQLEAFFRKVVSPARLAAGVEQVFPDPKPSPAMREAAKIKGEVTDPRIQAVIDRAEVDTNRLASQFELARKRREEMTTNLEKFNDEHNAPNTVYAFFQAATETISHSDTFTGDPWKQTMAQLFLGGQKNNMTLAAREQAELMMVNK